ncbi:hypothetical protein BO70DRAFT_361356 [Aspergillus heteromorphus CBS 117.55]|uniref:Uncharacterized protein n=1 Tax=Aspergillus heteromorphus CBS 117.55 TaxID=1448321 RepID=A0A317WIS2_9EURO|nr:uncharacterized protein BO70DRAFT_361356 [Aspergillus heteromorphus CBS 117.55]PWY84958.1 hypothetical protein BO70DRAFT_361356 [Aspergillus heteromorphus CBS 117.55]
MADSSEPHPRHSYHGSTTAHLQYPTLPPLSASVEEWLSRSRPISMTSTPPMDHIPRSLSESWATMSVSDVHSEDGTRSEQTDIGSLIDQTGPDDVASLDGRSSNSDMDTNDEDGFDGGSYESRSNVSVSQELPTAFPHIRHPIDDSNLTAQTAFRQSVESIEFIEPESWPEAERVELKHTIRVFEGSDAAELKHKLPEGLENSTLTATVQQTMTRKGLDTDKPFHVLYIGSPEFRNIILDKIGDVLVSSSYSGFESGSAESSRYHVVPTSFGAGAVPNFAELLPIHVQLIVDECPEASADAQTDKPSAINLNFKNRPSCTSTWSGTEYTVASSVEWILPDVAIFFLSSTDTTKDMETQKLARIFMERHGVPTMVISEKPLWTMSRDPVPLNHHSLHMCLESRNSLDGKSTVLRRYPIDLKSFESITPGQLNRNLASLETIYPKKSCKMALDNPKLPQTKSIFGIADYARNLFDASNDYELAPLFRFIFVVIMSAVAISIGHAVVRASVTCISQYFTQSPVSNAISPVSISVPATSILPTGGSLSALSSSLSEVQRLGNQNGALSQLQELIEGVQSVQTSDSYEIQVVGDCHLVIKPPTKSPAGRKQPKFNVQVTRGGKPLEYELSMLFEGVYTLKLDRSDAYGQVDVTIATVSKPPRTQTTSVDFGTPWLKIQNWKRAAHDITSQFVRELSTAQTGLTEAYGRICTDLQVLMGDVVKKTHFLQQEASSLRQDSVQLSVETKDLVLARSGKLGEVVKRTAVQPLLAASAVLQARANKVQAGAREKMSDTWDRISSQAQGFDLGALKEHFRNARKSKALDKAQKGARGLLRRKTCGQSECSQ